MSIPSLRRIRRALDVTQTELADAAGVSQAYISALERGHRHARPEHVDHLARALRVPPAALLDATAAVAYMPRTRRESALEIVQRTRVGPPPMSEAT